MATNDLLKQGIAALNAGRKAEARGLLMRVVQQDARNEMGWLWLSGALDTDEERRICLENVLAINPRSEAARRGLGALLASANVRPLSAAPPAKPGAESDAPTRAQTPRLLAETGVSDMAWHEKHAQAPNPASGVVTAIIIILLVVLSLFWLGIGFLQFSLGLSNNPYINTEGTLCTGIWNLFISVLNLASISDVVHRYRRAVNSLTLLAIVGSIFGLVQVVNYGVWLQILVLPLYVALGVLAQVNKAHFAELTPKELEKERRQRHKQAK